MKKVAILGATGYIGKSLVYELSLKKEFQVFLFSRSAEKIKKFLKTIGKNDFKPETNRNFDKYKYDVIINCAGIGNPAAVRKAGSGIVRVTNKFDDIIIGYLKKNPASLYVNLSSGAVYGQNFGKPIGKKKTPVSKKGVSKINYYSLAKIDSEARHRVQSNLNIVDLRIFSFFSRYINLNSGYFMADAIKSIKSKKIMKTSLSDIKRDYVGPSDLLALIKLCMKQRKINDFFDVYSKKPVSKFSILKFLENEHNLEYEIMDSKEFTSPTGSKDNYYSTDKKASAIGYFPKLTSLENIKREIRNII